jgi:hypothetical protein
MRRDVSEWDPDECVLLIWKEVLPEDKTSISRSMPMRLGEAVEFAVTRLDPKWQATTMIIGVGQPWRFDMIKAAFEKMRGSAL